MLFRRKRSNTAPVPPPNSNTNLPPEEVTKVKNPKRVTIVAPNTGSPIKEKDSYFFPFAMSVPANQNALLTATFSTSENVTSLLDQRSPSPRLFDEEDDDSDDYVDDTVQFTSSEAIPIGFSSKMELDDNITGRTRLGVPVFTKGVDFEIQQKRKNDKIRTKISGVAW